MAPGVIVDDYDHSSYLETSHKQVHDYESTKLSGNSEMLALRVNQKFGDWRDEFFSKGYVVLKGVVPRERALGYQRRALEWLPKFNLGLDLNDKNTWTQEHLPVMMNAGMVLNYCAAHEAWMWEARSEQGVIDSFAKLWGTDELLVSFDAVNITLPGRPDIKWKPWPHVDQAPTRKGLVCAQGIINLSEAGPLDGGLQVLQGSSELFGQFFIEHPPKPKAANAPGQIDWFGFTIEDVEWFEERGCKLIKVVAEPGDLIIWDSRTVHFASLPQSETIRTVIYATYTPASLATPEDLKLKAEIFNRYEATTHWPHCNIYGQGKAVRDGKICPAERDEPLEKPVLTEKIQKLAGLKAY